MTSFVLAQEPGLAASAQTCRLELFIDTNGKYAYRFDELAFLLKNKDDTIEFVLVNNTGKTKAHILKHISTPCEPKGSIEKKVNVLKMNNATVQASTPTNPYPDGTGCAKYSLNLEDHEMLHLGLVVEIIPEDSSKPPVRMICDPQVGNGPPPVPTADGAAGPTSR